MKSLCTFWVFTYLFEVVSCCVHWTSFELPGWSDPPVSTSQVDMPTVAFPHTQQYLLSVFHIFVYRVPGYLQYEISLTSVISF